MLTHMGLAGGYRFPAITNVAPFSYRDGTTYLELLESMRRYITETLVPAYNNNVNELNEAFGKTEIEIRTLIDDALVEVDRRIMLINNRVGPADVQHIALTADTVFSIDPALPDNHVMYVEVRQDGDGGHRLTFPNTVTGHVDIDENPDAVTRFELYPDGAGNWEIVTTDSELLDTFLSGGFFAGALNAEYAAKSVQETVETGRLSEQTLTEQFSDLEATTGDLGNRLTTAETTLGGRLSDASLTTKVQSTPVNARTFMPYATVSFGYRNGYRYENVHVRCGGKPVPGVLSKAYAKDFHLTSPTGTEFKAGPGKDETIQSFADRTGAAVVFNNTGWQTATDETQYRVRGPQIHNGIIYADFETSSNRGRHALGVHADGTIRPYRVEDGWTAQKMVDAGVVTSFTFGPLLVVDGIQQDVESLSWASSLTGGAVSGRTILGVTANHDIMLTTVVGVSADGTGVGGNAIAELAKSRGMHHAILLDGGGSTQAVANGFTYHPSSDSSGIRTVGDAGLIYAQMNAVPNSSLNIAPEPLKMDAGWNGEGAAYYPGVTVAGGVASFQGIIQKTDGSLIPGGVWTEVGSVPDKARPKAPVGEGAFTPAATGSGTVTARVQVRAYGRVSVMPSADTGSVHISGVSYTAGP